MACVSLCLSPSSIDSVLRWLPWRRSRVASACTPREAVIGGTEFSVI